MKKNNKKRNIIIALCILALGMGIGYSILQQQLKITGTGTVTGADFNVEIVGINEIGANGVATRIPVFGVSGNATTVNKGYTSTTANFEANFANAGDEITYAVVIKNTGGITAIFDSIDVTSTENSAITVTTPADLVGTYLPADQTAVYFVTLKLNYPNGYNTYTTDVEVTFNLKQSEVQDATRILNTANSYKPFIYTSVTAGSETIESLPITIINIPNIDFTNVYVSVDEGEYTKINLERIIDYSGTRGSMGFNYSLADYNSLEEGPHILKFKYVSPVGDESNELIYDFNK